MGVLNNVNRTIERRLPDKFWARALSRTFITCMNFGLASTPVSNFADMIPFIQSPPIIIIQVMVPIVLYWTLHSRVDGGLWKYFKKHWIRGTYHIIALIAALLAI